VRVAIVGCGPKGLFALERLIAHAAVANGEELAIDVFEPHPVAGAGPVYDPGQPEFLRMNFSAALIDMWWRGGGPVVDCRQDDFRSWRGNPIDDYPSRAEVGRYLADGLARLLRAAPPHLRVRFHRRNVESIVAADGFWSLRDDDGVARDYEQVMITTGHVPLRDGGMTAATDQVPAGGTAAIRGFALTFIDAALALTEGRGGRFTADPEHPQRLAYRSAPEAAKRIFPSSRTGRPVLAKPGPAAVGTACGPAAVEVRGRAAIMAIGDPVVDLIGELIPAWAAWAPAGRYDEVAGWLELACSGALPRPPDPAAEIRRSLTAGATPSDVGAWLGTTWRAVYPAVVEKLGGDGLSADQWPAFRRLSAELERVAFGPPPVNAAKLLALIDAGVVRLDAIAGPMPEADGFIDAVTPPPGVPDGAGMTAGLVAAGYARIAPGRRGIEISESCECIGGDGSSSRGLAAYGRPTEDWVIGNDTLSRSLHPQVDTWAARTVGAAVPA
jgi:diaminopimelate decarboxylase